MFVLLFQSQISTSVPCPGMSTSDQNQMISNYQPQDSQFNNHHVQNNISLTNLSEPGKHRCILNYLLLYYKLFIQIVKFLQL